MNQTDHTRAKSIALINAIRGFLPADGALLAVAPEQIGVLCKLYGFEPPFQIIQELEAIGAIKLVRASGQVEQWQWMGHVSKAGAEVFDAIIIHRRKIEEDKAAKAAAERTPEALLQRIVRLESEITALWSAVKAAGSGVTALHEMYADDSERLNARLAAMEAPATPTPAPVFDGVPGVVSLAVLKGRLKVGFIGPWKREWRFVSERLNKELIEAVHIDRDTESGLLVPDGLDYVLVSQGCANCATDLRKRFGDRVLIAPNGNSKLAEFANELAQKKVG